MLVPLVKRGKFRNQRLTVNRLLMVHGTVWPGLLWTVKRTRPGQPQVFLRFPFPDSMVFPRVMFDGVPRGEDRLLERKGKDMNSWVWEAVDLGLGKISIIPAFKICP